MTKTEIEYQISIIDQRIRDIGNWIEFYYSKFEVQATSAIDMKAYELGQRLDLYFHLRTQKEKLIRQYEEV